MGDVSVKVELDLDEIWNEIEENVRAAAREMLRDYLSDYLGDELISLLDSYSLAKARNDGICSVGESFDMAVQYSVAECMQTIKEEE